jgi:class 3 adenylate cyclase
VEVISSPGPVDDLDAVGLGERLPQQCLQSLHRVSVSVVTTLTPRMERVCPNCEAEAAADARFCARCGTELEAESRVQATERRVVSVVFVDLAGFTARAELLDPEDVQAILTPYHARVRSELETYGGTVEKFIGDAIVAVFGAPVAHGDDAERAVRAALAARDAIAEMNAADSELDLQVRVAVNTGEAVVMIGADAATGEGLVTGDVVNTAARLQTAAPVNGILVGGETYRATRSHIDYERAEPVAAKGKREPVNAWIAMRAVTLPGERRQGRAPLVGRERELDVLRNAWDGAVGERRPHFVTVFGPAGIGKTRLTVEFCKHVQSTGGLALRGRTAPYGSRTAYGPFAIQVKQLAGIFDSDPTAVAVEKLDAAVAELVGPDEDELATHVGLLIGLDHEHEVYDRQTLFLSARRLIEGLAAERPTMLVFEDLHWADESMLDLLEVIASRVRDRPLLLVALTRPELLLTHPSWGGGLPAYTALPLEPLADVDAQTLAAELLGLDDTAERIAAVAEGNPLFIEELAQSMREQKASPDTLPASVREIISARLDALPPDERSLVLDASVVGMVFWAGALEHMGWERDRVLSLADDLEGRDLMRHEHPSRIQGDLQFSFKHGLIRDVAYATLPRAQRSERHAAVAEYLETRTAERGAAAAAVAQHWREAGEPERALPTLLHAAEQAGRGWAKEEAVALYHEAAGLVPEGNPELRRDIARKLAVASVAATHVADARRLAHMLAGENGAREESQPE